jgi:hypothetical protein
LTLLLLLGWIALARSWFWTLTVLGILVVPSVVATFLDLLRKAPEVLLLQHLVAATRTAGRHFGQVLFMLACLPYEAYSSLDAILRTLVRLLFTHRRLLEWSPSREAERESDQAMTSSGRTSLNASFRRMWIAPVIAVAAAIGTAVVMPAALFAALPILLLWTASPAICWWISRPLVRRSARLTGDQTLFLRQTARRTWAFFEAFVGPDDHWLPPTNPGAPGRDRRSSHLADQHGAGAPPQCDRV